MQPPQLRILTTTREICANAAAWDDLWERSEICLPTKRGMPLALWLETFAPRAKLRVLVVERGSELLAALPLVEKRVGKLVRTGQLPVNSWTSAGDLLLDPQSDVEAVLATLISGFKELPWPLLWFDTIEYEQTRWQALRRQLVDSGLPLMTRHQFDLGLVDVEGDWQQYRQRLKKGHRKDMDRRWRRACEEGELEVQVFDDLAPDHVEKPLKQAFEVEERSWKGEQGTSVGQEALISTFFRRQAEELARHQELQVSLLQHDGWPIAFEYGYRSKGVYFSHKVGYDEAYRTWSPGQLLMMKLLERDHRNPRMHLTNCMGVLSAATAKWCTRVRPIARLVVGTGGMLGSAMVRGYRDLYPALREFRPATVPDAAATPQPAVPRLHTNDQRLDEPVGAGCSSA